jgi:hypothetical protein
VTIGATLAALLNSSHSQAQSSGSWTSWTASDPPRGDLPSAGKRAYSSRQVSISQWSEFVTGAELKNIREAFGLSASAMGRALGYSGPKANIAVQIRRLERDASPIPTLVARLAQMFSQCGIPRNWCA